MGPIEDTGTAPAASGTQPIVGYWQDGQVYCLQCAPALATPSPGWEPIRTQAEPVHDLVCWRCGSTVVVAPAHLQ